MSERTRQVPSTAQNLSDCPESETVSPQTQLRANKTGSQPDIGVWDDGEPVELSIERNGDQTLISTEIGDGPEARVVSAVDVSDVSLSEAVAHARRLRAAHQPLLEDGGDA